MDDMSFPWSNIKYNEDGGFVFGSSENIYLNPIQNLRKIDSSICSRPVSRQMGCHQLPPATMDSINVPSSFGTTSDQYWSQPLAVHEDKNVIPTTTSLESLDCFSMLSATNSNADTTPDHDDGISVIFSDYKNICKNNNNVTVMNNLSGVSSGESVEIDDSIVSQCSFEKIPSNAYGFYDDNPPKPKRPRSDPSRPTSSNINFRQTTESDEPDSEAIAQMKEMIYRAAAFRPVSFSEDESVEKPRRKNVRISSDPQTVAARQRRERISERIRVLQKLVPGGNKMDTASMLDEAANYLKFLRSQVKALEQLGQKVDYGSCSTTSNANSTSQMMQNFNPGVNVVTLGVPFPMQNHFFTTPSIPFPVFPNPPPA